ncbi:MAG: hypothetical protein R3B70_43220 [Polyangiaceae bacterium]
MRKKIIAFLLLAVLAGWIAMLALQKRAPHDAPAVAAPSAEPAGSSTASASASASASAGGSTDAPSANGSASAAPSGSGSADAGAPKLMDRTLRVTALGWDLAAPGLLANGGTDTDKKSEIAAAGLDVHIGVAATQQALEGALARGGEDKDGADIAILPLPTFVAAYERLRALSLDMFFVVGWSRGREAVMGAKPDWPLKGDVKLAGEAGHPATFLALWAFDLGGVSPGQVKVVSGSAASDAPWAAVDRSATLVADSVRNTVMLTTADAPRLIPYVAVAPRGLLENRSRALAAWASAWLKGARKLAQDAPTGARAVAATKDAPEPIALLQTLGQSAPATLADNVRAAGLSGRGAVTLEALFQHAWAIWRSASVLATPSPDAAPVSTAVISALARAEPAQAAGAGDELKPKDAGPSASVLITYRQTDSKADDQALVTSIGFLAGVFERAPLRISVGAGTVSDKNRAKKIIEDATGRFGLAAGRISPAPKASPQVRASVEVLSVP